MHHTGPGQCEIFISVAFLVVLENEMSLLYVYCTYAEESFRQSASFVSQKKINLPQVFDHTVLHTWHFPFLVKIVFVKAYLFRQVIFNVE